MTLLETLSSERVNVHMWKVNTLKCLSFFRFDIHELQTVDSADVVTRIRQSPSSEVKAECVVLRYVADIALW